MTADRGEEPAEAKLACGGEAVGSEREHLTFIAPEFTEALEGDFAVAGATRRHAEHQRGGTDAINHGQTLTPAHQ